MIEFPQVWKLPLNSQHPTFKANPAKVDEARQFAVDKGWAGIGWGLDGVVDGEADPGNYLRVLEKAPAEEIGSSLSSARSAHNAFANRMDNGDFVWCRWKGDIYYLGKIEGPWTYRSSGEFADYDLFQVRKCRWLRVGTAANVPGPVKRLFAGRGSTINQVRSNAEYVAYFSAKLWAEHTLEQINWLTDYTPKFTLELLGYDELEDLVGLFLQSALGWMIVPSTLTKTTPHTESVLIDRSGKFAYWQVKSGQTKVHENYYCPPEVSKFFVFDASAFKAASDERFEYISHDRLLRFVFQNPHLLPKSLRGLVTD